MSNRRFEMYEYRQIIFRLRQKESVRAIARAKLADRKKIRKVYKTAIKEGWLDAQQKLPSDEKYHNSFSQYH